MKPETFDKLKNLVVSHFNNASRIYVFDGFTGSSPLSKKRVGVLYILDVLCFVEFYNLFTVYVSR